MAFLHSPRSTRAPWWKQINFWRHSPLLVLILAISISIWPPAAHASPIRQSTGEEPAFTVLEETVTAAGVQTIARINVSKDAFLSSAQPNTNFGAATVLNLGWNAGVYDAMRMLIEFDIGPIPANATINNAELYIYMASSTPTFDTPMSYRAQYMRSAWAEGGVTWNNANYLGADALPLGQINNSVGWKVAGIRDLIQAWRSGSRPNHGLIITGDETPANNRRRTFYSKELAAFRPYVIVDYTVTCDTIPPTATVNPLPDFSPGTFPVTWSGVDTAPAGCPPSGIAHYDVDFRVNGGSWQRWKNQTQATTNSFKNWADNGDQVDFRARAADNAGNIQRFSGTQTRTRIDTMPPIATVNRLPEFTVTPSFVVTWSGTDNLSGIATYDVQYRENDGPWQWLILETPATSFQITGAQSGFTYQFRARATDQVGNSQEWDDRAQASTTVFTQPVSEVLPFSPIILKPTAPITDSFTVRWSATVAPGTTITNYEIYYQVNSGEWQRWQTVPGTRNSAVFPFESLGLGDGLYGFESVATNNLGDRELQNFRAEATIVVDLADAVQPKIYMPLLNSVQPPS